jgi:EmrB/QacA subfamily drug resistance transporter
MDGTDDQAKMHNKILLVLFGGVLMGAMDISIVGPAIPSIEKTISVPIRELGWIFSIYVLFCLVGVSLFAKLSDVFGRKIIYSVNLAIFAVGSLIVSFANQFPMLLIGRAIQGFGASGIFPVASAVIGDIFPPEKRGRALGFVGMVWGVAFILGPIIAGILLRFFEWHVLFLINIPIAIILIYFSFRLLSSKPVSSSMQLDWKGVLLLGIFLSSFTYAMNNIASDNFPGSLLSKQVFPFFILSFIALIVLILLERHTGESVMNLQLFRFRQIRIVSLIAVITGLLQASFVFIPRMAVSTFGVNSSKASFMLIPLVMATAIGSPVFGRLLDKLGSRIVILMGLILAMAGMACLSISTTLWLFYLAGAFTGFGLSILAGSGLRYIMLNEVGATERASTQGLLTILISLGQITGGSLVGVIIAGAASPASGYQNTFLFMTFVFLLATLASILLKSRKKELEGKSVNVKN